MSQLSLPNCGKREQPTAEPSHSTSLLLRFVSWCLTAVWRTCVDWQVKRPLLIRATAHLSVLGLALATLLLSGIGFPASNATMGSAFYNEVAKSAPGQEPPTTSDVAPKPTPALTGDQLSTSKNDKVIRMPVSHTTIPDRPRAGVITYTVHQGENVSSIAAQFGLNPYTIIWSNREILQDAPWLIQPGVALFILPVDGVYHTVRAGETVAEIADEYEVDPAALYNQWNDIEEDEPLREGQLLVVPGGQSEEIALKPPPPAHLPTGSAGYSSGICSGVSVTGPGANGWFVLPTGSSSVSGWYFHDPRNPMHQGLDYACSTGDPLYASDNGVVTVAGWNGGYGIMVEVNHGNGHTTRYAHLSELAVGCGQPVNQSNVIGYCGNTGWSTGSHLHFEIRKQGVPHDPQAYLPSE